MSIKIYFPRMLLIIFRYNSPRNEILEIKKHSENNDDSKNNNINFILIGF